MMTYDLKHVTIHMLPVLDDNYTFVVTQNGGQDALVVDASLSQPVVDLLAATGHRLVAVLNTHHHLDHVGANRDLARHYPELRIYGSAADAARIPGITNGLRDRENIVVLGQAFVVRETPGHTRGHIIYVMDGAPEVFVGDTLFGGGCGKLFEGTPAQMLRSLGIIRNLPNDARIWCAHEYTEKNYRVACELEPDNAALHQHHEHIMAARSQGKPTVPLRLGDEKRTNPFLRWDDPMLARVTATTDPLAVFTAVRSFRDRF